MVKENIMPSNKYKPPSSHSCNWRNATLCDLSIAVVLLAACWGLVSFGFEEHVAKHLRVSVPKSSNSGISAQTSPFPPSYWPKFRGQRYVTLLDGMWETANVSSQKDLDIFDSMNPNFDPCTINFSELMPVPSCVDRSPPGFMIPRGVYFFRRNFHFDLAPAGARLQFQGCSFYCRVWVNGKEIGDHLAGGYVAFTLDIPPQPSVDNDIFVLVDDRFNKTTAPMHTGGDFFHYGGIMRSVELHALPPRRGSASTQSLWPWRIYVIPNSLKSANITLHLTDRTYTGPIDAKIKVSFDEGPAVAYAPSTFSAINGVADLGNMEVPNPRVWSTVDPQLHTLLVEIDGAVLVERFGLRLFDIDESSLRIRLNGEVIKLLGWGHHTQWPDTAGSPTDEQLDEDILLLKAAGANFVRGAHYPQDARWLDRLDENGMVMWCETLGPNVSATDTIDPHFLKYQSQQMNEMLDNAMNHASVGIWAYFNEGPSGNNASCTAYQMNTDIIKSRDTSRLVSYASSEAPPKDVCYHAVDVVSINGYPEWYDKPSAKAYWSAFASYYTARGKTFLISESGVGAIYEWQNNKTAVPWTCAYQAKALVDIVEESISDSNVSGLALWHFFDFKSTDFVITGNWENSTHCDYLDNVYPPTCGYIDINISTPFQKPGGQNCKGVIDFWRRQKPSYGEVAKRFRTITTNKVIKRRDPIASPTYWPQFKGERYVTLLDGIWKTANISNHELSSFDSMNPNFDPSTVTFHQVGAVPSTIDTSPPGYMESRGVFFFRRRFNFDLTSVGARLQFQACSFYCRVWVNGREIGDHRAGGYVAFTLDIPPQASHDNEIFVLVDNRFNKTTAPVHTGGDFFHYGGILRSVELHALPSPGGGKLGSQHSFWPWRAYVIPDSLETVNVILHLTDKTYEGTIDTKIRIAFDEGSFVEYVANTFSAVNGVADLGNIRVPNPRIWSTFDPQLHTMTLEIDGATLIERFGLRMFDIDRDSLRLRLNWDVMKFVGWNHHTQWPDTGGTPTDKQMDDDISLLKEGGTNFVRGAHYPQDPRWLDRLDENGMIMWCETLGPDVSVADTLDPFFLKYQAQQMNEMLDNALNHASVAFWAFFNEGPSGNNASCQAYQMNADVIRSRDVSRFVSYASDKHPPNDVCFHDAIDVMAVNDYPGWYNPADPKERWSNTAEYYSKAGKPLIISETGAGGIYEWSKNTTASKWTCKYQTQVIVEDVEVALSDDRVSGISLWHFFDFKTRDRDENNTHCKYLPTVYPPTCGYINVTSNRPGGANHKGVLDFWRRPKPSFDEVSRRYKDVTSLSA